MFMNEVLFMFNVIDNTRTRKLESARDEIVGLEQVDECMYDWLFKNLNKSMNFRIPLNKVFSQSE